MANEYWIASVSGSVSLACEAAVDTTAAAVAMARM
jgi:hypothetical protein